VDGGERSGTIPAGFVEPGLVKRSLTLLFDFFLIALLVHYGMGGLETGWQLLVGYSPLSWLLFGLVVFLLLYRSDYRSDLPLLLVGWGLGFWGEWWGTTHGVWAYWNGATPPEYLPPLWGLGVITVNRLATMMAPFFQRRLPRGVLLGMGASFLFLPLLAFAWRWPRLAAVDWSGRLEAHFFVGLAAGMILVCYRFDLRRAFPIYLCGMLLGGLYEALGTMGGEWAYVTQEKPPLWIVPLWGLAAVAMVNLAGMARGVVVAFVGRLRALAARPVGEHGRVRLP
jgi:hypothetical protein